MPLEMVFQHLNINELYRLSWGAKNAHGSAWEKIQQDFNARLAEMKRSAMHEGWLKPQGVYGYFPCQADNEDLIIYSPQNGNGEDVPHKEISRFSFPRQPYDDHLALADYFASVDSGQMDVVAFQVVTVGQAATDPFRQAPGRGELFRGLFHPRSVSADRRGNRQLPSRSISCRELGLPPGQGKRYSWGYPAIPDLEDHRKVFDLLPAEKELGMSLSSAWQLIPEQSTAAIVVHHPQAKYSRSASRALSN